MAVSDGAILRVVAQLLFPDAVVLQNVFSVVFADTGGSNDEVDVISDIVDWLEDMYTTIILHIDENVETDEVFVYNYDAVDDDFDEVGTASWSVVFEAVDGMAPHGVAAVLLGRTTDPDVTGKKYVGGLQETSVDESNLGSVFATALGLFVADWITPFVGAATGGDFGPGIWSPTHTNHLLLQSGVVNTIVGYQRRRKPGVGV